MLMFFLWLNAKYHTWLKIKIGGLFSFGSCIGSPLLDEKLISYWFQKRKPNVIIALKNLSQTCN